MNSENMSGEPEDSLEKRILERIKFMMGTDLMNHLEDDKTLEIIVNSDGAVYIDRLGEGMSRYGSHDSGQTLAVIQTVASFYRKTVTSTTPLLEADFPVDGSRFAGQIPPVVAAPCFCIRKRASRIINLENYVDQKIMTPEHRDILCRAVREHKNIIIIGGTGSGKTTLVNSIINEIVNADPKERMIVMEDTGEIRCAAENCETYQTSADVSLTDLLKTSLRMRPDRIIIGEVRGPEALDLLDAWNTGHEGGIATLHANSARKGLDRLNSLISRNRSAPRKINHLIGDVVDIIVHICRDGKSRKIREVLEVEGYREGEFILNKK